MNFFLGAPGADPRHQWVEVIFFSYEKECFNEGDDVLHLAANYRGQQSELQRVRMHPKCTLL